MRWVSANKNVLSTVPALDSWRTPLPPQIQLWGPAFNIQEKITVHFHNVCTYTQNKHNDNIVSGVLGEGAAKPLGAPPHQLEGLGEHYKLPQRGPGWSPGDQQIFFAFWCAQNGSPMQHEAPEHAWAPPPAGGCGRSFLRLWWQRRYEDVSAKGAQRLQEFKLCWYQVLNYVVHVQLDLIYWCQ